MHLLAKKLGEEADLIFKGEHKTNELRVWAIIKLLNVH